MILLGCCEAREKVNHRIAYGSYATLLIQATDQIRSKKLFGLRSRTARFQRKCFLPISANLRNNQLIGQVIGRKLRQITLPHLLAGLQRALRRVSPTRSAPATTCWGSRNHRPACASARGAPAHSPGALGTDPRGSRDTAAEVRFLWQTSSESVAQAKPARAIQSSRPFLLPAKGCLSVRPFHHRQAEPGGKG
jgi:hypothetical protein